MTAPANTAADAISAFAAFCVGVSPLIAARDVLPHERSALLGEVAQIDQWISGFVVALSREPAPAAEAR
jgi:hypothetical protein